MKKTIFKTAAIGIAFGLVTSCSSDDDNNEVVEPGSNTDFSEVLENTSENVILKTYEDLAEKGNALQEATIALENNTTQANLETAKEAWVAARAPWEQSEGFLFGPVAQDGLDPALDSWPVNVTDLNNVVTSNNDLTVDFLAQQEGTLKGFHTVEFLLFGENGDKQASDITTREFEYLSAASGALARDTQNLFDLWKPSGGDFVSKVADAGNGSDIYVAEKGALEEITNALIIIADEVANGKINDPFSQQDLTLEESQFSNNSKKDFANNMRSIKNVYTGQYESFGNGKSISDIVEDLDSELNSQVISDIDTAIQSIESIPNTFSDAVFNNPSAVGNAQEKVRNLQAVLEEEVLPLISNL